MRKRIFMVLILILLGGCTAVTTPQPVTKSLYLNKKLVKFVIDNGATYRSVSLSRGRTLHYWRSDFGDLIAIAMGRDNEFPTYCEIALETDKDQIIRRIFIIEDSISCNAVLK